MPGAISRRKDLGCAASMVGTVCSQKFPRGSAGPFYEPPFDQLWHGGPRFAVVARRNVLAVHVKVAVERCRQPPAAGVLLRAEAPTECDRFCTGRRRD
eukprot:4953977-Pyramimonas_sp.AAC.1